MTHHMEARDPYANARLNSGKQRKAVDGLNQKPDRTHRRVQVRKCPCGSRARGKGATRVRVPSRPVATIMAPKHYIFHCFGRASSRSRMATKVSINAPIREIGFIQRSIRENRFYSVAQSGTSSCITWLDLGRGIVLGGPIWKRSGRIDVIQYANLEG